MLYLKKKNCRLKQKHLKIVISKMKVPLENTQLDAVLTRLQSRVSNGTGQRNFSGQRDSQNFFVPGQRDNGTEVPLLSRDKGTTGQAQNLATGRDGTGF